MNVGVCALSPIARRISPMRMFRFASTTYVFGQIRACRSAYSTTFGRLSIKPHSRSNAFGDKWSSPPALSSWRVSESMVNWAKRALKCSSPNGPAKSLDFL
jgi:hypothetical protein